MRIVLFLMFFGFGLIGFSQDQMGSDLELVREKTLETPKKVSPSKPGFGLIGKSFISRYNPISLLLSSALFGYQKVMSGQIASNCPYQMSCSNFAKSSLSRFGLIKGSALAIDRMVRCNKLSIVDVHPVRFNEKGKVDDFPSFYHLEH